MKMKKPFFSRKQTVLLDFASDYLETFSNHLIERVVAKAIRRGDLLEKDTTLLTQLKNSVSTFEIKYPMKHYVEKYSRILPILLASVTIEAKSFTLSSDEKKILSTFQSFYSFYEKRGYLTKKQIGFFRNLLNQLNRDYPILKKVIAVATTSLTKKEATQLLHSFIKPALRKPMQPSKPKSSSTKKEIKITPKKFRF